MYKLSTLDAGFLLAETHHSPKHVGGVQIFRLPKGKGSAWLRRMLEELKKVPAGFPFDPSVTWEDIAWLRSQWQGSILIKGVMSAEDALAAADAGADGVIVSNHGGRQLEGVGSSISMLPEVVAGAGDRLEVLVDGGVRNGTDVVRALALGAKAVLIGRPWVWAVAARGEAGVTGLLQVIQQEIARAMALMGVTRVEEITSGTIDPPSPR